MWRRCYRPWRVPFRCTQDDLPSRFPAVRARSSAVTNQRYQTRKQIKHGRKKKKEKSVACANQRPPCADRTSHSAAPSIDTHGTGRVALFCFWTGRSNWAGLDETRRDGKQACVSELEATTAAPVLSSQHLCATSGRGQQRLAQAQLRTRRQQGRRGHTEPTTKVPSLP